MDGADARAGEHGEHRLRHHRHIEDDHVALADAEVAQHGAEQLHLRQHAAVGEGLDRVGDGRIVDQRDLVVAAGQDVAVERVVAGVADAAGEPAAVDAGVLVEHLFRLLDPVDRLRRLAPEALRVALPARVDVVIAAGAGVHCAFPPGAIVSRAGAIKQADRHRRACRSERAQDRRAMPSISCGVWVPAFAGTTAGDDNIGNMAATFLMGNDPWRKRPTTSTSSAIRPITSR